MNLIPRDFQCLLLIQIKHSRIVGTLQVFLSRPLPWLLFVSLEIYVYQLASLTKLNFKFPSSMAIITILYTRMWNLQFSYRPGFKYKVLGSGAFKHKTRHWLKSMLKIWNGSFHFIFQLVTLRRLHGWLHWTEALRGFEANWPKVGAFLVGKFCAEISVWNARIKPSF